MKKRLTVTILSLVLGLGIAGAPVATLASASQSFYEGKRIRLVVGYPPGGAFDTWSRLIARHISRYIPGKPSIIVQNMPGAASLVAANWAYSSQTADGLSIVNFNGTHAVSAALGVPEAKFNPEKYVWVGAPTLGFLPQVLYVRPDVAKTLEQFLKAPDSINLGAIGRGTAPFQLATFLESVGAKVRVVGGYSGTPDMFAAIRRKEVDGTIMNQESAETVFKSFLEEGIVAPLVKLGPDNPGRQRLDIPNFSDLAKQMRLNSQQVALGKFMISTYSLAIMYALPPGTPAERTAVIRKAFQETLKDPRLLEEVTKIGFVPGPLSASDLEELVTSISTAPSALKELYKKLFL